MNRYVSVRLTTLGQKSSETETTTTGNKRSGMGDVVLI